MKNSIKRRGSQQRHDNAVGDLAFFFSLLTKFLILLYMYLRSYWKGFLFLFFSCPLNTCWRDKRAS